jgi:predicted  nucleic acid-binding Zn-ribbon protein
VLGGNRHRDWYNSGCGSGYAHKFTYEEWVNSDRRTQKEKDRDALIEHMQELKAKKDQEREAREAYERTLTQSNTGLRSWEARQRKMDYDRQVDAELAHKADEVEHERKRQWAIQTSEIERRIELIINSVDCSGRDRATMRMMLRYMNLGEGAGKKWDAAEFTRHMFATRRDDLLLQNQQDVERCYEMLKNRHMGESVSENTPSRV